MTKTTINPKKMIVFRFSPKPKSLETCLTIVGKKAINEILPQTITVAKSLKTV